MTINDTSKLAALLWAAGTMIMLSLNGRASDTPPAGSPPEIGVILWFDTEDYLSPADDDATLRLCELLTQRGIRATFKIVGEKARVLEQRGRRDVLAALRKHAIGYHANFHSVHPTPTEYLAECGWLEGVAEFARREVGGAADVRRILEVPTLACYGHPGSSWAPQAIAALKPIGVAPHGVPCYVDEGSHVGLNHQPFWYTGALNVFNLGPNCTRMELHDPAAVAPAKRAISAVAQRLREQGGGLISIYYHPCEWVHQEFWDAVNFRRGTNPPREQWQAPPQRPAAETEAAFGRFAEYIDHIRAIPGVRWVTAGDLPLLYPDLTRTSGAPEDDLTQLAERIAASDTTGLDAIRLGPRVYSLADQFGLLAVALDETIAGRKVQFPLNTPALFGPDSPPPTGTGSATNPSWFAFRDAVRDARQFVASEHRVPARVFLGPDGVAPGDFLAGMARAWAFYRAQGRFPAAAGEGVRLGHNARLLPEQHVAEDTPGLFGGWIIHRAGFRAPKVMALARLQAWTLKEAIRAEP